MGVDRSNVQVGCSAIALIYKSPDRPCQTDFMVNNRLLRNIAFWLLLLSGNIVAQPAAQTIIIGELAGRYDYSNPLAVLQAPSHPLHGFIKNQAIEVETQSSNQIVLNYVYPDNGHPDKLILRLFPSERSMMTAIIIDKIDFAFTESARIADDIHKSNPAVRIVHQFKPRNYVKMIAYNSRDDVLGRRSVRQALSYAINKNNIITTLLNNQASITSSPLDKKAMFYDSDFKEFNYAPRNALRLLRLSGWIDEDRDGILENQGLDLSFTIIFEQGNLLDEQIARKVKLDWNRIGIDVSIRPVRRMELKMRMQSLRYDAAITDMQLEETIDDLKRYWGNSNHANIFGYKNKTVDRYLFLAERADLQTRQKLIKGALNTIIQDQPASFLFFLWLDWYFINNNKFDNFLDENGDIRPFDDWFIKR